MKAKWAVRELINYNKELANTVKIPMEFKPSSLEFLLGLFEGLSYLCFFEIFNSNPNAGVGEDNLASLEREIAKWFYLCRDNLKANKDLMKVMKHVYEDVLSYYYNYNYNAITRTVKFLGEKHAAEKSKGWIGKQYAYVLEGEALIKQMDKDDKFADKKSIKDRFQNEMLPLKTELFELNKQVFKAVVPNPEELDEIKPIQTKVTPLEPKNIRIPPTEANYFAPFLSDKVEGLRGSLVLFMNNKKDHIQKTHFDLKEKIREVYSTYNIEMLKNYTSAGDVSNNENFKNNHRVFREMNGGKAGYEQMNMKLQQLQQQIESAFGQIDSTISNEDSNDQQLESIAGRGNMTSFRDANKGELNQLNRKSLLHN